ncbi:MAG TPA: hypothetical protein VK745_21350 [Polyangiaceae bacterium]|jgi:hypothetical protein|nr:hypothetical protein [Polyangiaceae bacterium]
MKNLPPNAHVIVALSLLGLVGCSSSSPAKASCTAEFGGNSSGSVNLPANCGVISLATDSTGSTDAGADSDAGAPSGYTLNLIASTQAIAQLKVSINLGSSPAAGSFSSENVSSWSATGISTDGSNCVYSAGPEFVPVGSFTLTLSSVDVPVSGSGEAHGTLDLTAYVHAPPATSCGIGNVEDVVFDF